MKRDLQKLSESEYDLLIIGGGIYGAAAAWDATLRGLKVAVVEQGDFAGATSSNSLKIIHGGLRYIQHADVKRMRESIRERRILMTIAPHLVHPLPCVMPLYGHLGKGPEVMRIALWLNDLVGFDRNRIADPEKILPPGGVLSAEEVRRKLPGIRTEKLSGGALWYDCFVYNSERLLLAYLHSSVERGAVVANYVRAVDLKTEKNRVYGVVAEDRETGDRFDIRSKMVLNVAGPWVNQVIGWLRRDQNNPTVKLSRAMNLVTRPIFSDLAAGIQGRRKVRLKGTIEDRSGKVYFVVPWRNVSLVGTLHDPYFGTPDEFAVTEQDVEFFLDNINTALPDSPLSREDVLFVYAGLLPMDRPDEKSGEVVLTKHYKIIDHESVDRMAGMVSVVGVKYTTARDVATKAVNMILRRLDLPLRKTSTDRERIFGGDIDQFDDFLAGKHQELGDRFPIPVINQLVKNYGSELHKLLDLAKDNPEWLTPLPGSTVLPVEIIHAIRNEMAVHLEDVVLRRTELGSAGPPKSEALNQVVALMANELQWDETRKVQELDRVERVYQFK